MVNLGVLLMLATALSVQLGGAVAATLIPQVGPMGTVALRITIATLIIAPIARPRLRGHSRTDWINVLVLGLCLGGMNTSFYFALGHLPYGVAVTVEFLGPLTLAALGSRSWRDVVAIIMALLGVAGVSGAIGARWSQLSLFGIGMALLAGLCWALYAKAAQRVGGAWRQLEGLWFAMVLCTLIQLPLGIAQAGANLLHPTTLLLGLTVAILSSALPYSFEMYALRRISTKVYGIIVGFEPTMMPWPDWSSCTNASPVGRSAEWRWSSWPDGSSWHANVRARSRSLPATTPSNPRTPQHHDPTATVPGRPTGTHGRDARRPTSEGGPIPLPPFIDTPVSCTPPIGAA